MYKGKKIGIVVPAYNEERFIEAVINTMPDFIDRIYVMDLPLSSPPKSSFIPSIASLLYDYFRRPCP